MSVVGVVCEYNPFHSGHAAMLAAAADAVCAGDIVCVMSGSFVQRGEPALINPVARAKAACLIGASAVFELPAPHALAPAGIFARRAIELLAATGVCTHIAFGCETPDLGLLRAAADMESDQGFRERMRALLASGISTAAALTKAASPSCAEVLMRPNNLLAVEYIRAMREVCPQIEPLPVLRSGSEHGGELSASHLRALARAGEPLPLGSMPLESARILREETAAGRAPVSIAGMEQALLAALRLMPPDEIALAGEVTEGLEHRIARAARTAVGFDELCAAVQTRRYTASRIRRALLCAAMRLDRGLQLAPAPYLRLLAARRECGALLRAVKKSGSLPLVSKPARAAEISLPFASAEDRAVGFYSLAYPRRAERSGGFYEQSPVLV